MAGWRAGCSQNLEKGRGEQGRGGWMEVDPRFSPVGANTFI